MSKSCFLGRVLWVFVPVPSPFAIRDDKAEATLEGTREILVKILEHLGPPKLMKDECITSFCAVSKEKVRSLSLWI